MIIDQRQFHRSNCFWQSGELWFSNSILIDLFDLPPDVRQIWVTLRDRKTASSMRLGLELLPPLCRRVSITTENESHVTSSQTYGVGYCLARLRVSGIAVVYVEVEYIEKE